MQFTIYVIPILFIILMLYSYYKKVNVYDNFISGSKDSLSLILSILPYIIAISIMIELFRTSNFSAILSDVFAPVFKVLGIPKELTELIILRPFSGNGTIKLLEDIYSTYGVDSYIARVASVLIGSSDTIFYIAVVYFSSTKIKSLRYGVFVALFAIFIGTITACLICKYI